MYKRIIALCVVLMVARRSTVKVKAKRIALVLACVCVVLFTPAVCVRRSKVKFCDEFYAAPTCESREATKNFFRYMGVLQERDIEGENVWPELGELFHDTASSQQITRFDWNCAVTLFSSERDEEDRRIRSGKTYTGMFLNFLRDWGLKDLVDSCDEDEHVVIAMTAAHCVEKPAYRVVTWGSSDARKMKVVFQVTHIISLDGEVKEGQDVAFLVLRSMRPTSHFVQELENEVIREEGVQSELLPLTAQTFKDIRQHFYDMIRWSAPKIGIGYDIRQKPYSYGGGWGLTYVDIPSGLRADFMPKWDPHGTHYGDKKGDAAQLKCARGRALPFSMTNHSLGLLQDRAARFGELQTCAPGDSGSVLALEQHPGTIIGVLEYS